jgi:hypothetical protein
VGTIPSSPLDGKAQEPLASAPKHKGGFLPSIFA